METKEASRSEKTASSQVAPENRPGIPKKETMETMVFQSHHVSGVFCLVLVSGRLLSF